MASRSFASGAVTGEDTPFFALLPSLAFSRRNRRNWRNSGGFGRNPVRSVTPATPVTPVSATTSPRIVRRRRAARSALMLAPFDDGRPDDENAGRLPPDLPHLLEAVIRPPQNARLAQRPRDRLGIEPCANLRSPRFGRNKPFAVRALALAPAGAVRHVAGVAVVERFKSIFAVRLDKPADLFNGLPGFRRFRSAALAYPLFERPGRRRHRLALAPRRHAQRDRQFARCRNQADSVRRPINLAVRARRNVSRNELA